MSLFTFLTTVLTNPSAAVDEHNNNQTNVRQIVKPSNQQRFNEKYGEFISGKVMKKLIKLWCSLLILLLAERTIRWLQFTWPLGVEN